MCVKIDKVKQWLLELLDDADVIKKVSNIKYVSPKDISEDTLHVERPVIKELESKCKDLETQLKTQKQSVENLQGTLNAKEHELNKLKQSLDQAKRNEKNLLIENIDLKQKSSGIQAFEDLYNKYLTLPLPLRESLSGIFYCENMWTFLFSGIQEQRLFEFWDFCMRDFKRGNLLEHRKLLCEIFDTFFDMLCKFNDNYKRQQPVCGDEFDSSLYSTTSGSDAVGNIQNVLLSGVCFSKNNKVFKKSIVEVKG